MSAEMQNGRPLAEAPGTPVVTSEGGIPTSDTGESSTGRRRKTLAERFWPKVKKSDGCWEWSRSRDPKGCGVKRFLNDFRTFQCLDVEPEVALPVLCTECGLYPAAWMLRCFTCNAKMRLPTC